MVLQTMTSMTLKIHSSMTLNWSDSIDILHMFVFLIRSKCILIADTLFFFFSLHSRMSILKLMMRKLNMMGFLSTKES